jgi:NMT1-like family
MLILYIRKTFDTMTLLRSGCLFALVLFLAGCGEKKTLTIISDMELGESKDTSPTILSLKKVMKMQDLDLQYKDEKINSEADIISLVDAGKVDIGIVKNDVDIHNSFQNVRTLLPLFPDVLLVLCKNKSSGLSIRELFQQNSSGMIIDKEEERHVVDLFLRKNGVDPQKLGEIHHNDSSGIVEALNEHTVLVMFASLNSHSVRNILRTWDGEIYSLDDPALKGEGSIVDGFCLSYPKAIPFIIPKGVFGRWPSKPVLTFSIYDVMVCHKDFDLNRAYSIVKTVYDMGSVLAEDDFEFGLLDANIESHKFSFPLHGGSVKYINRDQPTFWERESDLLAFVISLLALLVGGITTLVKYLKQRRKDRVDIYYLKVLQVADQARKEPSEEGKRAFLKQLHEIRNNAFDQLVRENLDANEAFSIFSGLLNATISELEEDLRTSSSRKLSALPRGA